MTRDRHRVVITGVTRGLGRALALGFARRGHRVAGCGRDPAGIENLEEHLSGHHSFQILDVTSAEVDAWAHEVVAKLGPPELLINNAALINEVRELWRVPPEEFSRIIDVNIKGVYNVTRAFLPAMIEAGRGVVVNLSSGWGRSVSPGVAPYCASKYAIEGMTKALAEELPAGMAAVPLSPGVVDTDMLRSAWGEGAASYPRPEEWAERAVPFLLGLGAEENGRSLTVS
jgi:NAD(P)-dependent dehydrogenase (short-subunit alcohol dehydrogenase family)